jgi:hypothetical protein
MGWRRSKWTGLNGHERENKRDSKKMYNKKKVMRAQRIAVSEQAAQKEHVSV